MHQALPAAEKAGEIDYVFAEKVTNTDYVRGVLAIRSHVDICDPRLLAVEALLELRTELAPYLDLQLVAFPQDGYLRDANAACWWICIAMKAMTRRHAILKA